MEKLPQTLVISKLGHAIAIQSDEKLLWLDHTMDAFGQDVAYGAL